MADLLNHDDFMGAAKKDASPAKGLVSQASFMGTDEFGDSLRRDQGVVRGVTETAVGAAKNLGKASLAAVDMFAGIPGQVAGGALDLGARIRALFGGESHKVQGLAGQEARGMVPEWLTSPAQSLAKWAGGGEHYDQSIVSQGLDKAGSWIEGTTKGLLTKEDVASLTDLGMAVLGVKATPPMVKYGTERFLERRAAPEQARLAVLESQRRIAASPEGQAAARIEAERVAAEQEVAAQTRFNETTGVAREPVLTEKQLKENAKKLRAEQTAQAELAAVRHPAGPAVWKSADTDFPVEITGEPVRGPDGKLYTPVQYGGNRSFVPSGELQPQARTAPTADPNAIAAPFERRVAGEEVGPPPPKTWIPETPIVGETSASLVSGAAKLAEGRAFDLTAAEKIQLRAQVKELEAKLGGPDRLQRGGIDPKLLDKLALGMIGLGIGVWTPELYKLWKNYQAKEEKKPAPYQMTPEEEDAARQKAIEFEKRFHRDVPSGVPEAPVPESPKPRKTEDGNYLAEAAALAAGAFGAVKGKGGMWHPEAVTRLSTAIAPVRREFIARAGHPEDLVRIEADKALQTQSQRMVQGYLNKHAGTATDPLKDIEVPFGEGTKRWEELTDAAIRHKVIQHPERSGVPGAKVGETVFDLHKDGWTAAGDVGPDASKALTSHLSHVGDFLREHVPPEKLAQYDLVRAVQETAKWDKELAKKMNDVRKAEKTASPVFKEYPDGMYWQQLTKPGQFARESDVMGHSVRGYEPKIPDVEQLVPDFYFSMPEEFQAKHPRPLNDLNNSSRKWLNSLSKTPEFMEYLKKNSDWTPESGDSGHPSYGVGGWDAIKSGDAKIYSLRDKEGRSHVTVEVRAETAPDVSTDQWGNTPPKYPVPQEPASILQIKGKQNRAPDAKYLPYVQDFVKGGKWGEVGDLGNTGLTKGDSVFKWDDFKRQAEQEGIKFDPDAYYTQAEIDAKMKGPGSAERGSADPKLLIGLATVGGGAALGAMVDKKSLRGAVLGGLLGLLGGTKAGRDYMKDPIKGVEHTLGNMSTSLSPAMRRRARDGEMNRLANTNAAIEKIRPFVKGLDALKGEAAAAADRAWFDGDLRKLEELPGMAAPTRALNQLLRDLEVEHKALGRFKEGLTNYLPRVVKDIDGLKNALGEEHKKGLGNRLLEAENESIRLRGRGMTEVEQSLVINRYLTGELPNSSLPGYARRRTIEEVTEKLRPFYYDPKENLVRYLTAAIKDIELAKFFGKDLAAKVKDGRQYTDLDTSIGNVVRKEMTAGRLDEKGAAKLQSIMHDRFVEGEQAMAGPLQDVRNITNAGLLGNVVSAATQIADPIFTVYHHGLLPTLAGAAKTALGKGLSPKELGLLNHISEELAAQRLTGKGLGLVLKASAFSAIDAFGKGTNINAGLIRNGWAAQGKNQLGIKDAGALKALERKWGEAYGEDFPQLVKDLAEGKQTPLTRSLAFSELSHAQPISMLEMPQAYAANPNGRLLWQLKSYMVKQMNVLYMDSVQEMAKGGMGVARGAKNLLAMATILALANIPSDYIKAWINGREFKLDTPEMVENILQTFGMNKFAMETAVDKREPLTAIGTTFVPPAIRMGNDLWKALSEDEGETKAKKKLISYAPVAGRPVYNQMYGGNEAFRKREHMTKRLKERDDAEKRNPHLKQQRLERQRQRKERAAFKAGMQ